MTQRQVVVQHIESSTAYLLGSGIDPSADQSEEETIAVAQRVLESLEAEQQRLYRDVHDGPAQVLANAIFEIEYLERIADRAPSEVRQTLRTELANLKGQFRSSLDSVRAMIYDLRPPELSELGLAEAMGNYALEWEARCGIRVASRLDTMDTGLSPMQELAFSHLYPSRYKVLAKATKAARGNRREMIGRTLEALKRKLSESGIEASVQGREKHVYSTYRKMLEKHLSFSEVHDIFGCRVIVKDVPACYLALGALHSLYKPIPGKFKDYIAIPKANGYQSLHTDLIGPYGVPVEVQVRTEQMHRIAQSGVASHWIYKDDTDKLSELQKQTHRWLQSLLEIQHQSGDPQEFLEHVKVDLFPDEVYVFTPKGKILSLPRGATAVDFAYAVHTDIGNRCVAAKVNGELVPLRTELRNGDRAEIITASHAKPNPGWLQYVRTAKARSNIRHFLKTMQYEESAGLGERLLDQAIKALNGSLAEVDDASWERVVRDGGARSREELLADIGLGKRLPAVVARRLLKRGDSTREDAKPGGSVVIRGTEGMAVQLATCCRPIPGDAIVGSIKKGQGLVVHASDCGSIVRSRKNEPDQWIDVEWDPRTTRLFQAAINAMENRRGVLAKVASEIAAAGSNIDSITMAEDRAVFTNMHFVVEVANRQHLARVMRALRRLPDVKKITRVRE